MANQPHHRTRRYVIGSQHIRNIANANPATVCRCGLTARQHPLGSNGKPQRWTAGHTIDGSTTWRLWTDTEHTPPPGDWLTPEMSRCNYAAGQQRTHGYDVGL